MTEDEMHDDDPASDGPLIQFCRDARVVLRESSDIHIGGEVVFSNADAIRIARAILAFLAHD